MPSPPRPAFSKGVCGLPRTHGSVQRGVWLLVAAGILEKVVLCPLEEELL